MFVAALRCMLALFFIFFFHIVASETWQRFSYLFCLPAHAGLRCSSDLRLIQHFLPLCRRFYSTYWFCCAATSLPFAAWEGEWLLPCFPAACAFPGELAGACFACKMFCRFRLIKTLLVEIKTLLVEAKFAKGMQTQMALCSTLATAQLGAFRTFLPGETRREDEAEAGESPSQLLPAEKVNDFGAHWQQ